MQQPVRKAGFYREEDAEEGAPSTTTTTNTTNTKSTKTGWSLRNSGNVSRAPLAGGLTCPPHDAALREPPPVLAASGLRCAPQHPSILLSGPRGSAHLHLKNTNAKWTTGCAQINAF